MEYELKTLAIKYGCSFTLKNETYDLDFVHRKLPHKTVVLEYENTNFQLFINGQFLGGISTTPSSSILGSFTDKYIFSIKCVVHNNQLTNFNIVESNFIRQWILKKNKRIKSDNINLKHYLETNNLIDDIYKIASQSAEICPGIICVYKNEKALISMNYQSFELNTVVIDRFIEFCQDLVKYDS